MAQEYLKRTPTSSGNSYRFTISVWAKRNSDATAHRGHLFNAGPSESSMSDSFAFYLNSGYNLHLNNRISNTYGYYMTPIAMYQDYSGWTHYLASVDTTHYGDQENKAVEYVNGVLQSRPDNATDPILQDYESWVNQRVGHYIGKRLDNLNGNWHGQMMDFYLVDGQALTPDVFGFYKDGNGYISAGSTQATDFRPGQWVPKTPRVIKAQIERNGGFGVNGVYIPLNDSSNFGADFHTTPNSIITLKGEDLPQPRNGAPTTTDAYVSQLRTDPYAANLVLAVPGVTGGIGTNGTSSGINTGFGDYSALIKGSGSPKIMELSSSLSIGATAAYYGSAMLFNGSDTQLTTSTDLTDFAFGTGDFTLECWYSGVPEQRPLFELRGAASATNNLFVGANGEIYRAGSQQIAPATGITTGQFTHIAVERNGSILTRYINGVATGVKTDFTADIAAPNTEARFGMDQSETSFYNGYIQDLRVYKGVAKYKGGFDVPKPYTPVGIATWRAVPDCTANNFATWNFISKHSTESSLGLTNGNLTATADASVNKIGTATVGVTTGKWYYEFSSTSANSYFEIGIGTYAGSGASTNGLNYKCYSGNIEIDNVSQTTVSSLGANEILGIAFNASDGQTTFYKDGVGIATISFTSSSGLYIPQLQSANGATHVGSANFGQNPTFSGNTTAGTFTDSNGKGLFKYEPPSGFLALCEDNLPTPAIKNPGEHFKTVLWTGDGNSGRSITGIGFTPDLVWMKARHDTWVHGIYDSVRGPLQELSSDNTGADSIESDSLFSFDNDGFSYGTRVVGNENGGRYVAWCWRAGAGTTSTNTDGSINSVVSVNQDAGFSIVNWTVGSTDNQTVGHGLGVPPDLIITKNRDTAYGWATYHSPLGATKYLQLESTNSAATNSIAWNNTEPTSTVFTIGDASWWGSSTDSMIAYCFAEVEGYSKFGSYVGNDSSDNAFVYCGFKPAMIIIKNVDVADNWHIADSSRRSFNPVNMVLRVNLTNAEVPQPNGSAFDIDFLSNGFKIRGANSEIGDPNTYIFAAWAESPFTTANAK